MNTACSSSELVCIYEIRLAGRLSAQWADWFDSMAITYDTEGNTTLTGPVTDQAALYGLIDKARDFGLPLLSVSRLAAPTDKGKT